MLLFFGALLFVASVAVVALATSVGPGESRGVARSLELVNYAPTRSSVAKHELAARDRLLDPMIDALRRMALRLSPSGTGDRLARSLDKAGNPPAWTIERIMGVKGIALFLGAITALVILGFSPLGILAAVGFGTACFFLPDLLIYNLGTRRQQEMQRGLADALDMLTVCVEAGQGFDAAILQVAKTVTGPIGGEFARVLSEIQIGKSRADAFAALGERTTAPEIKTFVSALVQADRMGLPVAAVLREQTKEMRIARRQRAEEQAQKVTVKILFPLLLCIFPALFIVIIGPGAIKIAAAFGGGGL
ncbi:secretion system protein TadC [Knoellia flava TL1]|uniref:Type II secretion system protein n=2 Tax=Knoellia flava TaxID=913969 RepID=A0A8H9FUW2_9MICO|nr:type II secretion system F family protein [Knoellia flava]KGN29739.1 secretion system protein TadC [Knoellia flava TL1]GGB84980.1 type II secretion system protein [Knoellia flava]